MKENGSKSDGTDVYISPADFLYFYKQHNYSGKGEIIVPIYVRIIVQLCPNITNPRI